MVEELDRSLDVEARDEQLTGPLCDERRLQVGVREQARVPDVLRELHRRVGVGASGVPFALAAVAPSAPPKDINAQLVGHVARALAELEGRGQELHRVGDHSELQSAAAELVEDLGSVGVREACLLGDSPCPGEHPDRLFDFADGHSPPGLVEQRAQLGFGLVAQKRARFGEQLDRGVVIACGERFLGARQRLRGLGGHREPPVRRMVLLTPSIRLRAARKAAGLMAAASSFFDCGRIELSALGQ